MNMNNSRSSLVMGNTSYAILDDIDQLSTDIRTVLMRLRQRPPLIDDGAIHYRIFDNQSEYGGLRAVIGIPTRGCSYARSLWGGCSICGHVASSLWKSNIHADLILADFEKSLKEVIAFCPDVLCLYTSGSFLDKTELPIEARRRILDLVAQSTSIKCVFIESLPHLVREYDVNDLSKRLPGKQIHIGMGLDSSDNLVRTCLYQRNIPLSEYVAAVDLCRIKGFQTTAYVVLGHPLLSRSSAISDTLQSIEDAFSLGFTEVSIEPVALQSATLQDAFQQFGLYTIPTINDVVTVLANLPFRIRQHGQNILLGGQVFTPIPFKSLGACFECINTARKALPFISPKFWNGIPVFSDADCCHEMRNDIRHAPCTDNIVDFAKSRLEDLLCLLPKESDCQSMNERRHSSA